MLNSIRLSDQSKLCSPSKEVQKSSDNPRSVFVHNKTQRHQTSHANSIVYAQHSGLFCPDSKRAGMQVVWSVPPDVLDQSFMLSQQPLLLCQGRCNVARRLQSEERSNLLGLQLLPLFF